MSATNVSAAAQNLLQAEETLGRVLQACEELEAASSQLADAKRAITDMTGNSTRLLSATLALSQEAIGAVRAVRAIDPGDLHSRMDAIQDEVRAQGKRTVITVWAATVIIIFSTAVIHVL